MKKVIVIGAGILGASTAYQLVKKGADVTVIDATKPGGATAAAAGIICPWLSQRRNKAWYTLARNGAAFYPSLMNQLQKDGEHDTGYEQVGALHLSPLENKADLAAERATHRREEAPLIGEVTRLSGQEAQVKFPLLASELPAVFVSGAARVDGRALQQSLLRAAQKNGATFIQGEAHLIVENERVRGVTVDHTTLEAETVIVCAGAWSRSLFTPLGLDLDVTYQKAQIAHFHTDEATDQWPVIMPPGDQYLLAFANGRLVAGATHENDVSLHNTATTVGGLHEVFTKALTIAPGLEQATFIESRTGFRPFMPGFLPMFGNVDGIEGLLAGNGLGASGLTMGPYIGEQLARLALDETPDLDLSPYSLTPAITQKKKPSA
ncbi:putative oxidoreductase yurR [Fictibacillus macauensis ZFHKF-1]|uniref:Putative oxidoreductase yurR n=1 Tax=Fictibacillus macauensis ZFHKF-1 TaxID=1196324 RepID=I8J4M7_9BACL|nr:FAD-binding oxidoreductase [Fictibacillus macauensis]EIT86731.1 putative oxidoreductase yurR [Fictibacillus macauensis ZFHKF-1]